MGNLLIDFETDKVSKFTTLQGIESSFCSKPPPLYNRPHLTDPALISKPQAKVTGLSG